MKKVNLAFAALGAMLLAGCVNDDNSVSTGEEINNSSIGFNLTVPGQTRATLSGKDAADKLSNEFVVFGIKGTGAEAQNAFTNYKVEFTENSAGTTESNSNNWEYVGKTPYAEAKVSPAVTTAQTVKYWDYSAANYTFTAFAGKDFLANENAKVEKITDGDDSYANGYTVTVPSAASLDKIFFSDRKVVEKSTGYNQPVALTFRNFGAKIRVGFYETIPGYSVKINKFYYDSDAAAVVTKFGDMTNTETSKFVAALQNVNPSAATSNTVTVTYYGSGADNENQPKVNSGSTANYQYTLTLGTGIAGQTLATESTNPTWDQTSGGWTMVYPNLEANTPMLIRCDYTLTSLDGSGETIEVKNARVTVPVQYCQWKSNYAYTYLFKISNNTNGTTGDNPTDPDNPDGPQGLYPITFDAVVVESTDYAQNTTTTNSVTSYAKDGYANGKDVYFVNTTKNTTTGVTSYKVLAPTAIGEAANNAQVYSLSWTSGSASIVEGDVIAQLTGLHNGLTMTAVSPAATLEETVPSDDGTTLNFGANGAVKFTPSAAGTYAYVYCTTKYVAPSYSAAAATTYTEGTTYYAKTTDGVYYVASGITDAASFANYSGDLYTKTDKGTAGVYDVKVITVK